MSDPDFYQTIETPSNAEFKDRGSKFIAFAFPIETADDFKKQLQALKKEHPKAVHYCFAYRIGTDARPNGSSGRGNNFRSGDDGEPSGTAGKPILGQLDSKGITNVAVIVVRYWGGTLLGVPGLINAYKTATALALQVTPIIQKQIEVNYSIEFDYTQMNEVMMVLKQFSCTIISNEMQLFCIIKAGVPKNRLEEVLYRLKDLQNVTVKKIA
ncbi:MAG: YigZ family protein [Ferruginibacter sp.]